jgi:hypothetical protein
VPLPERKRRSFPRSRFALAASIAILLTGGWLLSGSLKDVPGNRPVGQPTNGEATLPRVRDIHLVQPPNGPTELKMTLDQIPQQPMRRLLLVLFLLSCLVAHPPTGRGEPVGEEKGTYLGVLFSPVPEVLLDHLPQLPRDAGVLVTHVLPSSPAASAGLRRHDVLLQFDGEKIRDTDHLARLIQSGKPGQDVKLALVRGGKDLTVPVKLGLGPALRIARATTEPPGIAKPGGPGTVSVSAVPMEGNRMRITFEYSDSGKFRTVTCSGDPEEIDTQVGKLPEKVRPYARLAVRQLRDLDFQKSPTPSSPRN